MKKIERLRCFARESVVARIQAGEGLKKVAHEFDVSFQELSRFLRQECGMPCRKPGRPVNAQRVAEIHLLRRDGLTWKQIGRHFGVNGGTVFDTYQRGVSAAIDRHVGAGVA